MALTLVIGNKTYSSWSMRPWLLLRQFDIEFSEVQLALRAADWSERMEVWSPAGKVPVLHDGEIAIWDSLAIAEHVNEHSLGGRGWPADTATRALARCVVCEMHSGFNALRSELPMNLRREARPLLAPMTEAALADIHRVQQIFNTALEGSKGPFLFGDFGIADAYFAPVLTRLRSYGVSLVSDAVEDWSDRMLDLPAMRQWYAEAGAETAVIADYEKR